MAIIPSSSPSTERSRLLEAGPDTHAPLQSEALDDESLNRDSSYSAFQKSDKILIVFLVATAGFFSPFSAIIYLPALKAIATSLGVTLELMNVTVTMYLIVQDMVPAICGELSEDIGRRPIYLAVFIVYFIAGIGLIVDLHSDQAVTASASVSITRCAAAAGGVCILQLVLEAIGPGWTFTIFAILCFATVPILWLEREKGWKWQLER